MPHLAIQRLFATVALLLVAATASAGNVYEVNTTGATQTGSKNNDVYIGQSFNSGTNTLLTSASLEINRNGLVGTANFTLNLHEATGTPNNYFKTGSSLADATFSNSILSDTLFTFYDFTNLNWALSPNTVYMIGFASESTPTVKWSLNQSATKDSSTGFITGYSGYNAQEGGNVDDGLHGATITAVPEPSTHLVVGIAAAGMWLLSRRRSA
ncbi:MAG: PEP-CTERM sorting domain-containing protein [Planctomycetota bacterium]|jgi:hypothetical protein